MLDGKLTYVAGWLMVVVGAASLLLHAIGAGERVITAGQGYEILMIGLVAVGLRRSNARQDEERKKDIERVVNMLKD